MTVAVARSEMVQGGASSGVADRRLRIVHIYDGDYPTPDVRTEKISRALTDAACEVHIVARNRTWNTTREHLPEGVVHRMSPIRWLGRRLDSALGFPAFVNPRWVEPYDPFARTSSSPETFLCVLRRCGSGVVLESPSCSIWRRITQP
jgi:hypothetical protein